MAKAKKGLIDAAEFAVLDDDTALAHVGRLNTFALPAALARFGLRALPALAGVLNESPKKNHTDLLTHVHSPRFAAVAFSFHHLEEWLLDEPELAAQGLIPNLFVSNAARRFSAELGLLRLCAAGHRARVEAAAARYAALGPEVLKILDRDGSQRLPEPLPKLSDALTDGSLPVLVTAAGPLPAATIPTIGTLLSVSRLWARHPGLEELRQVCTQASRDAFAWELYQKTRSLDAVAHLGGDACVRQLDSELSHKRSTMPPADRFHAFKVLGRVGTPLAIIQLRKHALLSPYVDRARFIERILVELARVRGQSVTELENSAFRELDVARALPVLDFGSRRFGVTLDEHLKPSLRDEAGRIVDKLPKPTKKDDPAKAAAAKAQLQALELDLDDVRETVLLFFERSLANGRTWELPHFERAVLAQPLLLQLARRLVFSDGNLRFRVAEDGTFADASDARVELPAGARVAVAHPVEMSEAELAGFRQLFADYELIQPFAQLERDVLRFSAPDLERVRSAGASWAQLQVESSASERLLGGPGWAQDGNLYEKRLGLRSIVMRWSRAQQPAAASAKAPAFVDVKLTEAGHDLPLSELSKVEESELLRDLASLSRPP
ncbi:MAG: DUF4132 domain-containing protein [Polyangiaceae bacterium]